MSELWNLIQGHLDRYGVRDAEFARRMGSSPQTLNSWKKRGVRQLPSKELLEAVAEVTGRDYRQVLDAALIDTGYLPSFSNAADERGAQTLLHLIWVSDQLFDIRAMAADLTRNHPGDDDLAGIEVELQELERKVQRLWLGTLKRGPYLPGARESMSRMELTELARTETEGALNEDTSTQDTTSNSTTYGEAGFGGAPMKPKHPDNVRQLTRSNQPQHVDEDFDDTAPPPEALDFVARETPPGYKKGYDIDREDDDS
ncbi:hypothetical protein QNA23_20250 [Rhodococcus erythropolis]|uniref:helix-turn-helix domain-containing protein n=1 Tax=Rhodococcus erythropolis TaxID=1833 RepID=UPI0024BAA508|nr:hypothetical protein [Rhodococcus erythropolis]MDJ0405836.1 hypothetical protein [Rhodococcus erythropolis]